MPVPPQAEVVQAMAPPAPLLDHLQALEVELHHPGVRCDAARLERLLHPDFHEVGRSGRAYDRATIIDWLARQTTFAAIQPSRFAVQPLGPAAALLTYRSAHRREDGVLEHHTLRSSVWLQVDGTWQLRYHQGTPAAEPWQDAA